MTLVELMVAVILVGITVTSLSGLTFKSARDAMVLAGDGYLRGIMVQEVNRLHAVPFTQLAPGSFCVTVSTGKFPHTRCYKVVDVSKEKKTVTVVINPTQSGVRTQSTVFNRFQPSSYNPLNFP